MPECKLRCPSWKPYFSTVPPVPPCSWAAPEAISTSPPSTEVLLAAVGRADMGTQLGRGPRCSCLLLLLSLPWRLPENSLPRPRIAPDDCSLCSCPSFFRDSAIGFSSGTLLRMEKRKQCHRRQMALTQWRHLAKNCVKNSGTYGLNFPQLTQECNKSGPWKKAVTQPWHSGHLKESSSLPQPPGTSYPGALTSLSSSTGS